MKPLFYVSLFTTLFLVLFYNTVTNMAGLYIASDLGGSQEISVYPMVFFGLGNALTIPLAKFLAERFGAARSLATCLLLFSLISLFCSNAPTFFLFVFFRLLLGASSGPFYGLVNKLLFTHVPEEKKDLFSSFMVLQFTMVPVLGASFGAWLSYENHWRWITHLNQPLILLIALYFWRHIRQLDKPCRSLHFDGIGYTLYCLGLGCFVTAATLGQQLDWFRSPTITYLLAIAVPALIGFVFWESHHKNPIVDIHLLRNSQCAFGLLNVGLLFATYFGTIILIALWLKIYVNYTPTWIAILLIIMVMTGSIGYLVSRYWLHRHNPKYPLAIAITSFAISCYTSAHFNVEIDFFHLSIARALDGFGLALFLPPVFKLVLESYPTARSLDLFILFQVVRASCTSLGAGLFVILWQRRQVFFHERLGEGITRSSQLTQQFFANAMHQFHLTQEQASAQLAVFLEEQATSLALNDCFGFMTAIMVALLLLLVYSLVRNGYRRTSSPN